MTNFKTDKKIVRIRYDKGRGVERVRALRIQGCNMPLCITVLITAELHYHQESILFANVGLWASDVKLLYACNPWGPRQVGELKRGIE